MSNILAYFLASLASCSFVSSIDWDQWTALDDYVWREDGFFNWEQLTVDIKDDVILYELNMTSQIWLNDTYSSQPVWYHEMTVAIPKTILHPDHGMLIIGGGDNTPAKSDTILKKVCGLAAATLGAVVSFVGQVPNQPIVFKQETSNHSRRENSFLSKTWIDFILDNGRNPEMLARMPMTKSAKRALDATEELVFLQTGIQITKFTVTGPSKRGWTTWSLAAVDQRVIAIIPIVMDLLNMNESMMHHYRSMGGGWSFALGDFYYDGVVNYLTDPIMDEIYRIEDPMSFSERLTIPKLVVCATGDVFFLLTDSHYWWNDLPGNNWMMMNANLSHTMSRHEPMIVYNVMAFWKSIMTNFSIPSLSWEVKTFDWGNRITLFTDDVPLSVYGYSAVTLAENDRRDFRSYASQSGSIVPQEVVWSKEDVNQVSELEYQYDVSGVQNKWVGSFIQATYIGPDGMALTFSTDVAIFPDTFPVGPCIGEACKGELV